MSIAAPITLVLADDHALFSQALKAVLEAEPDIEIVALPKDGLQAVAAVERTRSDVALIDYGLRDCSGIQTIYLIRETVPECRILVMTAREDLETLFQAIKAGANGFLSKAASLDRLVQAIRSISRGETVIPPLLMGPLLDHLLRRRADTDAAFKMIARLTKREREVLAILAAGGGNDSIADRLAISPQTARTHVQNVLTKLNLHSRLQAAAFVNQNSILGELMEVDG